MMRSLFSAVSGLKNNQTAMDVIGNNIANVNTIGYKSSRTIFQDIYSQTISTATAPTTTTGGSNAQQVGLGVTISAVSVNTTDGSTESTSNPLDFAISGDGYFVVSDGNGGYYYTRNGEFQLDKAGYLVTANGDYVMACSGDATVVVDGKTIAATDLTKVQINGTINLEKYSDYAIDSNGFITALNSVGTTVTLGRLVLATFNNAAGLEKAGSSYCTESANSGSAVYSFVNDGCGYINSGSLEMSNVDLATELTNMIITERAFQANSRVITTSDTMLEELVNLKR